MNRYNPLSWLVFLIVYAIGSLAEKAGVGYLPEDTND